MARISIGGVGIDYELVGEIGAPAIALTPGGRFPKDSPGLPELAAALAAGGRRVLLWDRPNCGLSDLCLDATTESELHGETLGALIGALELGPTALAAGSAGARVSLIAASRYPTQVSHLALWWISGGPIGLMQLSMVYCGEAANLASMGGMEAVLQSPAWGEQARRHPAFREALLALDVDDFIEVMQRWTLAYRPSDTSPVPGMAPTDFAALTMPVLLMRNGKSDVSHTRATSDWVQRLIPHAQVIDPPWPDNEWNIRASAMRRGDAPGIFVNWPAVAPDILRFTGN